MCRFCSTLFFWLVTLGPFVLVGLSVVLAVLGKAYGNFPYQPDETEVFSKYSLPRSRLRCFRFFDRHKPQRKPVRHRRK